VVRTFLRWSFGRGACARGWWLVASVYLVVVADLSPSELVLLGTGQGITVVLAEVPAGVFADTVSRKWSLVVACTVSGTGMVVTGLVTGFPALVVAQALWGLGWAFASGADVAWLTDELDRADRIDQVLAARARWELTGAIAGLAGFGVLGWVIGLRPAVVLAGLGMAALGMVAALRFPERRFVPAAADQRWRHAASTFRGGLRLALRDGEILVLVIAWLLVNGSGEGYGRLVEKRLVGLNFGAADPIIWFAGLGLVTLLLGAVVLRAIEHRIAGRGVARRAYLACCAVGVLGLAVFAGAPDARWGVAGVLLASGCAHPGAVLRAVGEIWVNRRTTSSVRATVHSVLSQAEHVGEITFGLVLASVAAASTATTALACSALLLAAAGVTIAGATTGAPEGPRRRTV
jgi:MFS family permease